MHMSTFSIYQRFVDRWRLICGAGCLLKCQWGMVSRCWSVRTCLIRIPALVSKFDIQPILGPNCLVKPHSTTPTTTPTPTRWTRLHSYGRQARFPEVIHVASWTTRRHSRDDLREDVGEDVGVGVGVVECGLNHGSGDGFSRFLGCLASAARLAQVRVGRGTRVRSHCTNLSHLIWTELDSGRTLSHSVQISKHVSK